MGRWISSAVTTPARRVWARGMRPSASGPSLYSARPILARASATHTVTEAVVTGNCYCLINCNRLTGEPDKLTVRGQHARCGRPVLEGAGPSGNCKLRELFTVPVDRELTPLCFRVADAEMIDLVGLVVRPVGGYGLSVGHRFVLSFARSIAARSKAVRVLVAAGDGGA